MARSPTDIKTQIELATQTDPVLKKLSYWGSKLIDLSKRNRLINFKETRSSTVKITLPSFEKIFTRLVKREKTLTFLEPEEKIQNFEQQEPESKVDASEPPRQLKALEIFGESQGGKVSRALYNLRLRAKTAIQETGINVLYVAFCMLEWREAPHSDQVIRSPLVLVPVKLERDSVLEPYTINVIDSEIIINPSLTQKLQSDFGITLPSYDEMTEETEIVPVIEALRELLSQRSDWVISDEVYLGLFSFSKLIMFKDLEKFADLALSHNLVRALAGDPSMLSKIPGDLPKAEELDDRVHPVETFQVLDADSSQQEAIIAAKRGVSFVLQGPPGTGKSQTIANIISECLADGKRVLFVSEKMAALEVVKKRLDSCNLGEFCLELHSHKANKRAVIDELNKTLNAPVPHFTKDYTLELNQLKSLRDKLNSYVRSLHRKRSKFDISPFQAHEQFIRFHDAPNISFPLPAVLNLDHKWFQRATSLLSQLADMPSVFEGYIAHPWYGFSFESVSFELTQNLEQHIVALLKDMSSCKKVSSELAQKLHLIKPVKLSIIYQLVKLLKFFSPGILQLDAQQMLHNFSTRYTGVSKYFNSSYWKDLKAIRSTSRETGRLSREDILKALEQVRDLESNLGKPTNLDNEANVAKLVSDLSLILLNINNHLQWLSQFYSFQDQQIQGLQFDDLPFADAYAWLNEKLEHLSELSEWIAFERIRKDVEEIGLKEFIDMAMEQALVVQHLEPAFQKRFYQSWIDATYLKDTSLQNFIGSTFRSIIKQFKTLDVQQIEFARKRVSQKLAQQRPHDFFSNAASSEQAILRHEGAKKRKHKPIRQLFSEINNLLLTLKPCFLMSPLSISHYLDPQRFSFDVVVFDEASQILPENAIGAIMRCKQTIVVGDDKQLPPTGFFNSIGSEEFIDEEITEMGAFDSILEECSGLNIPQVMLKWHYRSEDESLISFSNYHFYDNGLNTFPNTQHDRHLSGVEFVHVSDGIYDMGKSRQNVKEARRVAELAFEHFQQFPSHSLGVVAFSQAQQMAILDQLEIMRRSRPEFESFFDENKEEAFFVKNLENVQGDERDVMFFSIGYAKDGSGKPMPLRFGPLNKEGGHRRLNVAITRAKKQVKLIASIQPTDIDLSRTNSYGVKLLRNYMEYAQHKGDMSVFFGETQLRPDNDFDSPFEQEVWKALTEKGYTVHSQVGCSGYRIDLAVTDPRDTGRFILGIECDGASYHSSKTARDRDRLRQQVLEQKYGWKIYRIWSRDWIEAQERELEKLAELLENIQDSQYQSDSALKSHALSRGSKEKAKRKPQKRVPSQSLSRRSLPLEVSIYKSVTLTNLKKFVTESQYNPTEAFVDAVTRIVEVEGPIHRLELARRIAECYFTVARAGKKIQSNTLWAAKRSKSVVKHGDFFWPASLKQSPVRVPPKGKSPRNIEHIDLAEIGEAVNLCINNAFSMTRNDLVTQTAKLLGFNRTGEKIRNRVNKSIDKLVASGKLMQDGDRIKKFC